MQGHPITIRLLDPLLHELPDKEELLVDVIKLRMSDPHSIELKDKEQLLRKVHSIR